MSRFDGLSIGIVRDVDDPTGQGLIQVDLPTLPGRSRTAWAMVAAPMAGNDRGLCFMPELEDQAIVGFLSDAPDQPVILGYSWNGVDKPPTAHPRQRIIRSLNGHTIRMVDGPKGKDGAGELVIEDANGNKVILSNGKIRLDAVAVIEINAPHVTISGPGWSRVISPINNKPI